MTTPVSTVTAGARPHDTQYDNPHGDIIDRWKVHGPANGMSDRAGGLFNRIVSLTQAALYFFHPDEQIPLLRERLNSFSGGEEFASAGRILGEYIHQYVKHIFEYPPHLTHDNPHWTAALSRDEEGRYSLRGAGIHLMLEHNESKLHDAIEATLLNGMGGISERIHVLAVDRSSIYYDDDFLLNLATQVISIAANHFRRVNETLRTYGDTASGDVIRADFGNELHRGMSGDARLNPAERRKYALEGFFQQIGKEVTDIALPDKTADVFTVYGSQAATHSLLRETVVPNVLLEITEQVISRRTINSVLLNALDALNAPEGEAAVKRTGIEATTRRPRTDDRKQRLLNKACAKLSAQIIALMAPTAGSLITALPGIADNLGTALGAALRPQLEHARLDKAINASIEAGLPSLHPGEWQTAKGRKVFVPGKVHENGNFMPAEKLSFTFPKNDFDRRREREHEEFENEKLERRVIEVLDHTINRRIKAVLPGIGTAMLGPIRRFRDVIMQEFLPPRMQTVARGIGKVLGFLIGTVVGTVIYILCYPLTRLAGMVVDRYSRHKAEEIIYRLHMDIHRNLAYNILDEVVKSLKLP